MKHIIVTNRNIQNRNKQASFEDETLPFISVRTYKGTEYTKNVAFTKGTFKFQPESPLKCGAKLWFETQEEPLDPDFYPKSYDVITKVQFDPHLVTYKISTFAGGTKVLESTMNQYPLQTIELSGFICFFQALNSVSILTTSDTIVTLKSNQ